MTIYHKLEDGVIVTTILVSMLIRERPIGKEVKKWKCEWFSGNECDCTDCKGLSVRDVVKGYIKLFLEMQNDELIQKIESDIDEMEDLPLCTRIDHTVTKYADDIEEKLQEARNKLDSNDWDYSCFFS